MQIAVITVINNLKNNNYKDVEIHYDNVDYNENDDNKGV